MKHLFIPYELAVIALEKGFDERCVAMYYNCGTKIEHYICGEGHANGQNQIFNGRRIHCLSPLYQQILDWFRNKHNIYIELQYVTYKSKKSPERWRCLVYYYKNNSERKYIEPLKPRYVVEKDYYIVLNKAIEKAFKLI